MLDGLLRILTGVDDADRAGERNDPAFAPAVLLIEVARSDDTVEAREQGLIERALARRFGLQPGEVTRLVKAAEESAIWATDLFHLTRVVENFTEAERIGVIEMLWEVAYSDDLLTGDEDALIRRVAGLIYVSDRTAVKRGSGLCNNLRGARPASASRSLGLTIRSQSPRGCSVRDLDRPSSNW
jgi:uncharacterized tellurite resistance protein B-like protein